MSESQEAIPSADPVPDRQKPAQAAAPRPWVTGAMSAVCIVIFLGLTRDGHSDTWETLARWGAAPPDRIWEGAYWYLVSCTLVHQAIWHLGFNLYWLWVLGTRLERAIGSGRFLLFVLVAAVVSSGCQLATSGTTGIGASGVVYAIFGFMWLTRDRFGAFRQVLSAQIVQMFLLWLGGCMVATYLGIWNIGNAAHLTGLLFGVAVAGCFVLRYRRKVLFPSLAGLIFAAVVPLFWCPWSPTWLGVQGYRASRAGKHAQAIAYYNCLVQLEPDSAWAFYNRGVCYFAQGDYSRATTDFQKAASLDSKYQLPEDQPDDLDAKRDPASPDD